MSSIFDPLPLLAMSAGAAFLAAGEAAAAKPAGSWTIVQDPAGLSINMSETLMADGRVLIAGGGEFPILATAEIFTPKTNSWAMIAPMLVAVAQDTATLLPDGTILAAGGTKDAANANPQAQAEIYDPKSGAWSFVGNMQQPRFDHMAILLKTGKVLLCGGTPDVSTNYATCELYNPKSGKFSSTGSMSIGRRYSSLVMLPSGDILTDGDDAYAEIYLVASGTWHIAAQPPYRSFGSTLSLLANGTVMEAPSLTYGSEKTELYDPATDSWALAGAAVGRVYATAATLRNGSVLSSGGCEAQCSQQNVASASVYYPASRKWVEVAPMHVGREDGAAVGLPDGRVLVVGGYGPPEVFAR